MATGTEMRTLTCPGPPEHEFQIPKGRGRPPRYCEDHKPSKSSSNGKSEEKVAEQTQTRARPRPGAASSSKSESDAPSSRPRPRAPRVQPQDKHPLDEPTPVSDGDDQNQDDNTPKPDSGLKRLPPPGRGDRGSRAKGEAAARRSESVQAEDVYPRGADGKPMAKIDFSASELIPTGQYANVTIGPVRVTTFIDLSRDNDDMPYFTESEKDTLIKAANELAEMMERDVLGVQRNLVLESLQSGDN